jgi:hypothetical protein
MNTGEELFKAATQAMEEKVFLPTVMAKLAERGYQAKTQAEFDELLKCASSIRSGVAVGELAPIPAAYLPETGEITKQAAEAASQNFLAFAPEVNINIAEVEPVVKEAAAVLAWGFMKQQKDASFLTPSSNLSGQELAQRAAPTTGWKAYVPGVAGISRAYRNAGAAEVQKRNELAKHQQNMAAPQAAPAAPAAPQA